MSDQNFLGLQLPKSRTSSKPNEGTKPELPDMTRGFGWVPVTDVGPRTRKWVIEAFRDKRGNVIGVRCVPQFTQDGAYPNPVPENVAAAAMRVLTDPALSSARKLLPGDLSRVIDALPRDDRGRRPTMNPLSIAFQESQQAVWDDAVRAVSDWAEANGNRKREALATVFSVSAGTAEAWMTAARVEPDAPLRRDKHKTKKADG